VHFRFSPRPNRAHDINWHIWSEEAFARAEQEDRPLFLSLSTTWCHWCATMDETTFSDPIIIEKLNEEFVPVRVDADERPDLYARYGMGGWPSFAVLTPEGELMTGATYQPPDELLEVLLNVTDVWSQNRDDIRREVAELQAYFAEHRPGPGAVEPGDFLIEGSLAPALPSFDEEYGGFGRGSKFPRPDILEALLYLTAMVPQGSGEARDKAPAILLTTLDAVVERGLHDQVEGGFFRYATTREWEFPHHEKLLADNALLIRLLAAASQVFSRRKYLDAAESAQAYLDSRLWLKKKGVYASSQAPDLDYYQAEPATRRTLAAPAVDDRSFASGNALAARALAHLYVHTAKKEYAERAASVVSTLCSLRSPRGLVWHSDEPTALDTMLADQIDTLCALLDLHEAGIATTRGREWLDDAVELWTAIDPVFSTAGVPLLEDIGTPRATTGEEGAALDIRLGRMTRPQAPVQENCRAAAALARMGRLLKSSAHHERALAILGHITPTAAEIGNYAAELATAALVVLRGGSRSPLGLSEED
jgi:hypothetical protein